MASRTRVTMHVDQHFRQWGDSAMRGIELRLHGVMPLAADAAKSAELRRHSRDLVDSIHPLPVTRSRGGVQTGIGAGDYKANWYEQGTLARRSRRKSARGKADKAAGSSSGVKPLHFLRKGLYSMRTAIFHEIGAAMDSARSGLR